MRGTLKTSTLESKFPLLRVENNCIISKFADITAAYRVLLPELFTLTGEEYEALHGAWLKALKVLPDYTVVHKQDFFIEERYTAPEEGSERSFLARSYERHFNERPYLRHTCYLFVTKTTPERMRQTSASSVLCRGFIVPREMRDTDAVTRFLEAAEQMERILNDSGLVRVERLTETEIVSTADEPSCLARLARLDRAAVVDIGGGTTGTAVISNGKVIASVDDATGGHHVTLAMSGALSVPYEDAELKKRGTDNRQYAPIVRPVFERISDIVKAHISGHAVDTVYLTGGTCCFPGIAPLFEKELGIKVECPDYPLLLTPLAIACLPLMEG